MKNLNSRFKSKTHRMVKDSGLWLVSVFFALMHSFVFSQVNQTQANVLHKEKSKSYLTTEVKGLKPVVIKTKDGKKGWKISLPEKRPLATPAVWNDIVFVGAGFGSYEFYALDAKTGKVVWRFHTGDDGPTAAVVKDGYVAFNTESCILYVLKARTGEEVWHRWLGDPLMSMPAIEHGKVYMAYPGNDGKHYLACIGLKDGKNCWKAQIEGDLITAPVVDGKSVYITCLDGTVYRFDAMTGAMLWSEKKKGTSAPTVYKDQVFLSMRQEGDSTKDGRIQYEGIGRLENRSGKHIDKDLWVKQKADYLKVDKTSRLAAREKSLDASVGFSTAPGTAKMYQAEENLGQSSVVGVWSYQGSRPAVVGDRSYQAMGENLMCMDIKSGKKIWEQSLKPKDKQVGGRATTPPSIANSKLFLGTTDGEILCVSEDGKSLWSYKQTESIRFQPAISKGRVFFTTDNGSIYMIETGDPSDDGWCMWGGNSAHNGPCKE